MTKQWSWSEERLVERINVRLTEGERLRLLDAAVRLGRPEQRIAREALLAGLSLMEREAQLGVNSTDASDLGQKPQPAGCAFSANSKGKAGR